MHILDEPRDCYTNRNVRGKQIAYDISYKWDLKKWYKGAYLQNRNRPTDIENTDGIQRGKGREGIN